jgi:hypothetical protein
MCIGMGLITIFCNPELFVYDVVSTKIFKGKSVAKVLVLRQ